MTLTQFRVRVRAYANDPSTSGTWGKTGVNELTPDAMLDGVGEEEYREACNLVRRHSPGFFRKTLVTATSSTEQHSWPSDFIRLYAPIVVDNTGASMTASEAAGDEVSKGTPSQIHETLENGSPQIWVPESAGFRLYPKATTAGSKALLLRYEFMPTFPSTGTDTFTWPVGHEHLLVLKTAAMLRELHGLPAAPIRNKIGRLEQDLLIDLKQVDLDQDQFPSSFWDDLYTDASKQGRQA
jgi:hypothetical protein